VLSSAEGEPFFFDQSQNPEARGVTEVLCEEKAMSHEGEKRELPLTLAGGLRTVFAVPRHLALLMRRLQADENKREEPERRTGLIVKDDARTARPITRAKPSRRRFRGVGS